MSSRERGLHRGARFRGARLFPVFQRTNQARRAGQTGAVWGSKLA